MTISKRIIIYCQSFTDEDARKLCWDGTGPLSGFCPNFQKTTGLRKKYSKIIGGGKGVQK